MLKMMLKLNTRMTLLKSNYILFNVRLVILCLSFIIAFVIFVLRLWGDWRDKDWDVVCLFCENFGDVEVILFHMKVS